MGTHYISDDCISCGACEPICPMGAITLGDPLYVIERGACTDCGQCDAVCPMYAIKWVKTGG